MSGHIFDEMPTFGEFTGGWSDFLNHDVVGGAGRWIGSFFGQNEDAPGTRVGWGPLLGLLGTAVAGGAGAGAVAESGAAGGGAAGGSSFVGDIPLAGEGGTSIYSNPAVTSETPYWQKLLRNQAINRGIGLLSSNGGGQQGGNNTVSTPSSGFYGSQPTTQPQLAQPQQQPTMAEQNQASNQQLGMGGLLRRNQSGYGRAYG